MKNTSKKLRIVPRGVMRFHNGESAVPGEAETLVNMREREDSLDVVGEPLTLEQLDDHHRRYCLSQAQHYTGSGLLAYDKETDRLA